MSKYCFAMVEKAFERFFFFLKVLRPEFAGSSQTRIPSPALAEPFYYL